MLASLAAFVAVAVAAIAAGLLANIIPLPYPASSPAQDILPENLPSPRSLSEVCGESLLQKGQRLHHAVRLFEGLVQGSESVSVGANGSLFMLDKYGFLHRADERGGEGGYVLHSPSVTYVGPGRPLAFHVDEGGNIVVCDSLKGLVLVEGSTLRTLLLTSRVSADPASPPGSFDHDLIRYANDLDIAPDGVVYFSDSSTISPRWNPVKRHFDTMEAFMLILWKGEASGRVLSYDPRNGETRVVAKGLWGSNGVALSEGGEWLAVVETCSMRIRKLWLKGPKAGQLDVLVDRLPGFPDGITRDPQGNFWVALLIPSLSPPLLRALPYKALRVLLAWLPDALKPAKKWGVLLKVTPQGEVCECLVDEDGSHISSVSAVTERQGRLFLGNLGGDYVSYYDTDSSS